MEFVMSIRLVGSSLPISVDHLSLIEVKSVCGGRRFANETGLMKKFSMCKQITQLVRKWSRGANSNWTGNGSRTQLFFVQFEKRFLLR